MEGGRGQHHPAESESQGPLHSPQALPQALRGTGSRLLMVGGALHLPRWEHPGTQESRVPRAHGRPGPGCMGRKRDEETKVCTCHPEAPESWGGGVAGRQERRWVKREKGEEEQEEGRWGSLQLPELEASQPVREGQAPLQVHSRGWRPGQGQGVEVAMGTLLPPGSGHLP